MRETASRLRACAIIFVVALAGFMLFYSGHEVSGDNAQRLAWAHALIEHHSNDLSPYLDHSIRYTKYGIGQPILHIPFVLAADAITRVTGVHCDGPVNMMLYELNAALGVTLVFAILVKSAGLPRGAAVWRAFAVGFTTIWAPASKVEYGETIVATLLMAAWLLAEAAPFGAGLIGGFAIAVRMDAVPWFGLTALCAPIRFRDKIRMGLGATPAVALVAWSNFARTGSILRSGYEHGFIAPILRDLYGFLLSPGKSVFLFSPLLLLYPFAAFMLWRDRRARPIVRWSLALGAGSLIFYAKWWDWSGDDAWGPRLLIPAMMAALIVVGAIDLSRPALRRAFAALAAIGFVMQLPPLLIGPHQALMLDHLRRPTVARGPAGARTPVTLHDTHYNVADSQITDTFELLMLKLAPARWLTGASWLAGFEPPLTSAETPWDVFWLHRPGRSGPTRSPDLAATPPARP